ncbi:hypothetical protein [Streptomyces mayteni]
MPTFEELAASGTRELAETLAARRPAVSELTPGEWLGIVQLFTQRLTDEAEAEDLSGVPWGSRTTAFAHVLDSAVASGAITHRESVVRRLNASSALLRRFPPDEDVDLLDPGHLVDLLLGELPLSVAEARELSYQWPQREIEVIRLLRRAKLLLSPVVALMKVLPEEYRDDRLAEWEAVFPSLP